MLGVKLMLRPSAEVQFAKIGSTDVLQVVGTDLTLTTLPGCISGGYHYVLNGFEQNMFGFAGYVLWGERGEAELNTIVSYLLMVLTPKISKGSVNLVVVNFCHEPNGNITVLE